MGFSWDIQHPKSCHQTSSSWRSRRDETECSDRRTWPRECRQTDSYWGKSFFQVYAFSVIHSWRFFITFMFRLGFSYWNSVPHLFKDFSIKITLAQCHHMYKFFPSCPGDLNTSIPRDSSIVKSNLKTSSYRWRGQLLWNGRILASVNSPRIPICPEK